MKQFFSENEKKNLKQKINILMLKLQLKTEQKMQHFLKEKKPIIKL